MGPQTRVELEDLVIELPGAIERRNPILTQPIGLIEIGEGQDPPRRYVIRVEIDRALCEFLRFADIGRVEAKVDLTCFDEVLPGFEVMRAMVASGKRPAL